MCLYASSNTIRVAQLWCSHRSRGSLNGISFFHQLPCDWSTLSETIWRYPIATRDPRRQATRLRNEWRKRLEWARSCCCKYGLAMSRYKPLRYDGSIDDGAATQLVAWTPEGWYVADVGGCPVCKKPMRDTTSLIDHLCRDQETSRCMIGGADVLASTLENPELLRAYTMGAPAKLELEIAEYKWGPSVLMKLNGTHVLQANHSQVPPGELAVRASKLAAALRGLWTAHMRGPFERIPDEVTPLCPELEGE